MFGLELSTTILMDNPPAPDHTTRNSPGSSDTSAGIRCGLTFPSSAVRGTIVAKGEKTVMREGPASGSSVLIVDDEEAVLRTFQLTLQAEGIAKVATERDGSKALARIEAETPTVVLLDLTMPGVSGQELLPLIRSRFPHVSVVIVTGNAELETAVSPPS